ncbi:glycosyltransferase family 4 protein [Candidatus Falkowbacteria bacterium]|nr:glycosyltransferase family 4 protein [Candidatus Falkowbacteria bacterium]
MKKILYIVTQSEFGGAQRYIFDLAAHIKNDFDVVVAAGESPDGELFQHLKSCGIENRYLSRLKRRLNPIQDILAIFEIRQLIQKEKPDIIHLNSSKAGILGSLATMLTTDKPKKVIYTTHGWAFNEPSGLLRYLAYFLVERLTVALKDKIICVSDYDRRVAVKGGFPKTKLIIIHNGIDFNSLNFLTKEEARQKLSANFIPNKFGERLSLPPNRLIVGAVANLYSTKGIEYLIEAANIMKDNFSRHPEPFNYTQDKLHEESQERRDSAPAHWRAQNDKNCALPIFIVIGEGPERKKLEELIKKYDLEASFFLLGRIVDARRYLKAFDVFVLPSIKEGFPYAVLEAMVAGLPIVATEVGGLPEMACLHPLSVNERTTLTEPTFRLTKPKNSQQLAENILYLLDNPEMAVRLAEKAREIVKISLGLSQMVKKTTEVYIW